MPADASKEEATAKIEQHNHGRGVFIARDNHGTINTIDPTTSAILKKLSVQAPALANLLRKALEEGQVSSEVAFSLQFAAQHINEDVAAALMFAGQNINQDVADSLQQAASKLEDATGALWEVSQSFIGSSERTVISQLREARTSIANTANPGNSSSEPMEVAVPWDVPLRSFGFGALSGVIFAVIIFCIWHFR